MVWGEAGQDMIRGIISPTNGCDAAGDFLQVGIHRRGVDDGKDQPRRDPTGRADGTK